MLTRNVTQAEVHSARQSTYSGLFALLRHWNSNTISSQSETMITGRSALLGPDRQLLNETAIGHIERATCHQLNRGAHRKKWPFRCRRPSKLCSGWCGSERIREWPSGWRDATDRRTKWIYSGTHTCVHVQWGLVNNLISSGVIKEISPVRKQKYITDDNASFRIKK